MNWDAVGAIGEIFGGVAVLVTLIYLSFQLRQTHLMMRAQAAQARTDSAMSLHTAFEQLGLVGKPESEYTQEDISRIGAWNVRVMMNLQNVYFQKRLGLLDEMFSGPVDGAQAFANLTQSTFAREWWESQGQHLGFFGKEFVDYVNQKLKEHDVSGT